MGRICGALYRPAKSDCLKMTWTDEKSGLIGVRQGKTGKRLWIPMHRELQAIWNEMPRVSPTVLCSVTNRPWTPAGFGKAWHCQMQKPEFSQFREKRLVFHGLRKSAVVMLTRVRMHDPGR